MKKWRKKFYFWNDENPSDTFCVTYFFPFDGYLLCGEYFRRWVSPRRRWRLWRWPVWWAVLSLFQLRHLHRIFGARIWKSWLSARTNPYSKNCFHQLFKSWRISRFFLQAYTGVIKIDFVFFALSEMKSHFNPLKFFKWNIFIYGCCCCVAVRLLPKIPLWQPLKMPKRENHFTEFR